MTKLLLAAALLAGAATAATAEPDPPGGPCHVYYRQPIVDHGIPGVPGVPGRPYLYCDY